MKNLMTVLCFMSLGLVACKSDNQKESLKETASPNTPNKTVEAPKNDSVSPPTAPITNTPPSNSNPTPPAKINTPDKTPATNVKEQKNTQTPKVSPNNAPNQKEIDEIKKQKTEQKAKTPPPSSGGENQRIAKEEVSVISFDSLKTKDISGSHQTPKESASVLHKDYGSPVVDNPDKDNDGILDDVDDCPTQAGPKSNKGCPIAEGEPDPNKFIPAQKRPEPTNMDEIRTKIGYPKEACESGIEGEVVLKILVDEEGKYVRHIPLRQGHPILLKQVENHVAELRFTLAFQGAKPIKYWLVVPFKFKLTVEEDPKEEK